MPYEYYLPDQDIIVQFPPDMTQGDIQTALADIVGPEGGTAQAIEGGFGTQLGLEGSQTAWDQSMINNMFGYETPEGQSLQDLQSGVLGSGMQAESSGYDLTTAGNQYGLQVGLPEATVDTELSNLGATRSGNEYTTALNQAGLDYGLPNASVQGEISSIEAQNQANEYANQQYEQLILQGVPANEAAAQAENLKAQMLGSQHSMAGMQAELDAGLPTASAQGALSDIEARQQANRYANQQYQSLLAQGVPEMEAQQMVSNMENQMLGNQYSNAGMQAGLDAGLPQAQAQSSLSDYNANVATNQYLQLQYDSLISQGVPEQQALAEVSALQAQIASDGALQAEINAAYANGLFERQAQSMGAGYDLDKAMAEGELKQLGILNDLGYYEKSGQLQMSNLDTSLGQNQVAQAQNQAYLDEGLAGREALFKGSQFDTGIAQNQAYLDEGIWGEGSNLFKQQGQLDAARMGSYMDEDIWGEGSNLYTSQARLSKAESDFGQKQFGINSAYIDEAMAAGLPKQVAGAKSDFISAASDFDPDTWADRAKTDTKLAYDQSKGAMRRDRARMGLNPNSGSWSAQGQDRAFEINRAADMAGNSTRARQQGEEEKFRRLGLASQTSFL